MPWGRERGAGVSPLHRSCPTIAPRASPPIPQAWPEPTVHGAARRPEPQRPVDAVHPSGPPLSPLPRRPQAGAGWVLGPLPTLGRGGPWALSAPPRPRRRHCRAGPGKGTAVCVPVPAQAVPLAGRVLGGTRDHHHPPRRRKKSSKGISFYFFFFAVNFGAASIATQPSAEQGGSGHSPALRTCPSQLPWGLTCREEGPGDAPEARTIPCPMTCCPSCPPCSQAPPHPGEEELRPPPRAPTPEMT